MAFQVSPGVNISEIDASTSVPALVTNIGAMVGRFSKGPVGQITEVSSEEELVTIFGKPNNANYKSWFTAANFLAYSNSLKIVRVANDSAVAQANKALNAVSGKVTVSSATAGTQTATGTAESSTTIYGSSAQTFTAAITGSVQSFDLFDGVNDGTNDQYLLPRLDNTSALVTANGSAAGTDSNVRDLVASDVTVSVRGVGETSGGLVPASRYALATGTNSGDVTKITLQEVIGDSSNSGPWYIHAQANAAWKTDGTGYATGGFFYPLYTRMTDANAADSAAGGTGSSHGHYFSKYASAFDSSSIAANTITLTNANHGFVQGDVVIFKEGTAGDTLGLTDGTSYYVASVSGADVTLSETYTYSTNTAGAAVTLSTGAQTDHMLHKVFYMPDLSTLAVHEGAAAPADTNILLWANKNDEVVITVALQQSHLMDTAPGSHAVQNGLVTATNSVDGAYSASDFTVSANSTTITFTSNAPATGETVTVVVPARRSFPLSPAVDSTAGQTLEVDVAGTAQVSGTDFTLSADGATVTFSTAPADAAAISFTIRNAAANSFSYTSATLYIKNDDDFDNNFGFGAAVANGHEFAAKHPGIWANNMKVYLVDETTYSNFKTTHPAIASALKGVPRANDMTIDLTASNPVGTPDNEKLTQGLSLVVTMTDPQTGTERVVETIEEMSKAANGKTEVGENRYYVNVINSSSNWVKILNHPIANGDWGGDIVVSNGGSVASKRSFATLATSGNTDGTELFISRPFGGGQDGITPTVQQFQAGYDMYADAENVDVGFILQGEMADVADSLAAAQGAVGHIIDIAISRKDAIACISPREADVAADRDAMSSDNTIAFFQGVKSSNYAFADSNYKYMSDKFNNTYRYVPFNGDTAGLMVRSELERDAWYSPAGFNRGVYRGVVKTMQNQTKADRDALYSAAINPVVSFAGQGTVLFGDKTFTQKPSAFSRINVRRLFIVLEKSIATAAKFTLFEFNDEFTRSQFTSLIEPFLRDVQGRRGIYDFKVVCDATNNTSEVIDRNEFIGDIFIQPARSINFIQLNFVAVRTGVDFNEIVGAV